MFKFYLVLILIFSLFKLIWGCSPFCTQCDPQGSCINCQLPLVPKIVNGESICWAPDCELGTFYSNKTKNCQYSCQHEEYPHRANQICVPIDTCPMIYTNGGTFHKNGVLQSILNSEQDMIVSIGVNDTKIIYNSISNRESIQVLDVHDQSTIRIAIDEK